MIKLKKLLMDGLSLSDYFDDSIPYEQKPVPCLTPMEEDDFPIQTRSMFPRIDEGTLGKTFWMSPDIKLYDAKEDHYEWAYNYIERNKIPKTGSTYETLFNLGWIRILITNGSIYIEYKKISNGQLRELKNLAIENNLELYDDTIKHVIDLNEKTLISRRNI